MYSISLLLSVTVFVSKCNLQGNHGRLDATGTSKPSRTISAEAHAVQRWSISIFHDKLEVMQQVTGVTIKRFHAAVLSHYELSLSFANNILHILSALPAGTAPILLRNPRLEGHKRRSKMGATCLVGVFKSRHPSVVHVN